MADEKRIDTGGGAAFLGSVSAGHDVVGGDQTNYYGAQLDHEGGHSPLP